MPSARNGARAMPASGAPRAALLDSVRSAGAAVALAGWQPAAPISALPASSDPFRR
jgi:hypothetical protein